MHRTGHRKCFATAVGVLLAITILIQAGAIGADDEKDAKPHVVLHVDYGDGSLKGFTEIPFKAKMTPLDAMEFATKHPRGVRFVHRGSGATAFLQQIDDLENEGGGGRNWMLRVNGKLADRSFALVELHDGDVVLWKFERYR